MATPAAALSFLIIFSGVIAADRFAGESEISRSRSTNSGLCAQLILPSGYPCSEHTTQTEDGYLLGLQRVSSSMGKLRGRGQRGRPVLLLHGLFMGGDAWFLDSTDQSLGYVLADHGFDVWVGNVRGTHWSHGHVNLSVKDKDFWDWSWQELALYDLAEMLHYVNHIINSKVFVVGHSQGTIMSLAAFTQPAIVKMVAAAALICPISYLDHITAPFVLKIVHLYLDDMMIDLGIHQLNFKSEFGTTIMDMICDSNIDCNDLLTPITGKNCCFNESRTDFYLDYEPHPSSAKNLHHLFQMIRKGTFAKYDYGMWKNMKTYGYTKPPKFDLSHIPASLPMWMGVGGTDALADVKDVQHTLKELQCKPEVLYLPKYGHLDFLLSVNANKDVYENLITFLKSSGNYSRASS